MRFIVLLTFLLFVTCVNSQVVNVPDSAFKACLLSLPNIDLNGDGDIQVSEATNCTTSITCSGKGISDMTGLEAFPSITYLSCSSNNLTSLDVSTNFSLVYLYCWSNQLETLDVSNNANLAGLSVAFNELTELDLSHNINLTTLNCRDNHLSTLDVSSNLELNNINTKNNNLSSLNVKNDNNHNFILLSTLNNPNLTCFQVDDPVQSENLWTNVNYFEFDNQHVFSENCYVGLTDNNLIDDLPNFVIFPNPAEDAVTVSGEYPVDYVTLYDLNGTQVLTSTSSSLSIEHLLSGVYLVKIVSGEGEYISRFIKN